MSKMLSWLSEHDAFNDHTEMRENLGDKYFSSGL